MGTVGSGRTALGYLDAANTERQSGNHQRASALMWKATQATFATLADARGVRYEGLDDIDLFGIADALESDGAVRKHHYRSGIAPGSLLKDHAEMEVLEDYQLELAYETAEQFIRETLDDQ